VVCAAFGVLLAASGSAANETASEPAAHTAGLVAWTAVALLAGATRTSQTFVNASLSRSLSSKADAASWSLGTATLLLGVLAPVEAWVRTEQGSEGATTTVNLWMLTGGFFFELLSVRCCALISSHLRVRSVHGYYAWSDGDEFGGGFFWMVRLPQAGHHNPPCCWCSCHPRWTCFGLDQRPAASNG